MGGSPELEKGFGIPKQTLKIADPVFDDFYIFGG
jgi:hypothetical protein